MRTPVVIRSLSAAALVAASAGPVALAQTAVQAPQGAANVDLAALEAERLPINPKLTTGTLENGLSYIVMRHSNPPGRLYIRLHVSSGSLNETDRQRGLAHFLEHLAFNGSKHYPPGSVVPFFESLGLTFGRHQNAFTSFDQTAYMLDLPNVQPETIEKGMLFMSDVLGRLDLLEDEVEKEKQIILEEKRRGLGPDQRLVEQWLPALTPGSLVGERLPIGTEQTITGATRQDFVDYYKKWYTTGNSTLIVVGDADPATLVEVIKKTFSDIPAGPRPDDVQTSVKPYQDAFAFVATDKELTRGEVRIVRADEVRGPTLTAADLRADLVTGLGTTAFNRRLQKKIASGEMPFRTASAGVGDNFNTVRFATASAVGKPDDWKAMLTDLTSELKRAVEFGFTERELEDAKAATLAQIRQFAAMENTLPATVHVSIIMQDVNQGETPMAPSQQLAYMERLLPTINPAEVNGAFRDAFRLEDSAYMVLKPSDGAVPSESEVLAAAREALNAEITAEADDERPESLMSSLPTPGKVAEMSMHPASQVRSFWLDNNVRVHHRFMDYRKEQATVTITIAGGEIEETASTRGLTSAAAVVFNRPATSELSSTNIRDLLTGKAVNMGGFATTDALLLTVAGNPKDLEPGLQAAHLLLTDPKIEAAALEQWKQQQLQSIEARKTQPSGMLAEVRARAMYPKSDPRFFPLEKEQVEAITLENAQRWLDDLLARAPIEVAVVGDISEERAIELVKRYLGSLPARDRISDQTLSALRVVDKPAKPRKAELTIDTQTKQAYVWEGFYGPDADNVRDARLMDVAARILSSRMIKRIREDEQLVYSIGARSYAGVSFPGFGTFSSGAPTEPGKAPKLASVIREMFEEFAANGPTEEEITIAKGQVANVLDEQMKEPSFWTGQLSDMTYRDVSLDDVMNAPESFQAVTREEVHQAFKKYWEQSGPISALVMPKA